MNQREQLEQVLKKKKQLEEKEKELRAKIRTNDRKARNHRMMQLGGVVEEVMKKCGGRACTDDDVQKLRKFLYDQEHRGKYFTRAMNTETATPTESKPTNEPVEKNTEENNSTQTQAQNHDYTSDEIPF